MSHAGEEDLDYGDDSVMAERTVSIPGPKRNVVKQGDADVAQSTKKVITTSRSKGRGIQVSIENSDRYQGKVST